jgi:uncharacterized protein with ParB-like and HNH nuclease domain/predicted transport protein
MKASEARFLDFLKKSMRLVIPIYQRNYSWTEKQCEQLWDDVIRAGEGPDSGLHFVGSVVYVQEGLTGIMDQSWLVIDGQQRLTTVSLLLEALARAIPEEQEPVEGFSSRKIRNYYLLNNEEVGDKKYKLALSENDNDTLHALLAGRPDSEFPSEPSKAVLASFNYFKKKIDSLSGQLDILCKGLAKLALVDISLDREHDNPQLIFESMNSTGKALSQADLIRNYILMGLPPHLQGDLYKIHWRPMEKSFGQEAYGSEFDAFMRHYLTVKTGSVPRVSEVYDAFKAYSTSGPDGSRDPSALVSDIHRYSKFFCNMALGQEPDSELKRAFQDQIQDLNTTVALPFMLEMYSDYEYGELSRSDFLEAVRLIESYTFRRAILEIPTNSMNKTFSEFSRFVRKDRYLDSIKAHFLGLPSYRRFPRDTEFSQALQQRDMYNIYSRQYWLRKLENHGKLELIALEECTVEHVLPQNPELSKEWRDALGENWKEVQAQFLHNLGNLTLTRYNSSFSDRPYSFKRSLEVKEQKVGLAHSPFSLNSDFAGEEVWDQAAINRRARRLAGKAIKVWVAPELSSEALKEFEPELERPRATDYTYGDHKYLSSDQVWALFDALKSEVLALDPCVTELILKQYVAFKAESNFVDVVPQAKRLRLSLNMKMSQIDDPRKVAKDISGVGRWGNGDVEIGFESLDQLPYVMSLIRQSFNRQMSLENESS